VYVFFWSGLAKLMKDIRIAIWNWNKIIVGLATGVWVTTIAFLIQGKSIPLSGGEIKCSAVSGVSRVYNHPVTCLNLPNFIHLQFRSSINVEGCAFRVDSIRLSTIATFASDIILILIMLFGLYRLRRGGGGLMGLGRLLWNQVGWERFYRTLDLRVYFLCKGVVWLLLAVTTELSPMVSRCISLSLPFAHRHFSCRCSLF
jgi:hypothetical protein